MCGENPCEICRVAKQNNKNQPKTITKINNDTSIPTSQLNNEPLSSAQTSNLKDEPLCLPIVYLIDKQNKDPLITR